MIEGEGLLEIQQHPKVFIQLACAPNQTVIDVIEIDRNCLFAKHLLGHISSKNVDVTEVFRRISDNVYEEARCQQKPLSRNGLTCFGKVYLNKVLSGTYQRKIQYLLESYLILR
jgi:hypothetical protein